MDQDIYRKVLKHQSQLQRLECTIERCKHSLLDVQNLLDSLRRSNKELMDVAAKTAKDAKLYNRGQLYAPSNSKNQGSTSAKKQIDAKPYNRMKQYAASYSTSQSSTSSRKQYTDDLKNLFKKMCIQDKQIERHPKNKFKK